MVEFELTSEQEGVRDLARAVGDGVVAPAAKEAQLAGGMPAEGWSRLLDTGLVAPVAEDYGGGGLPDLLSQVLAAEELAAADPAIAASAFWSGNAALLVGLCGTASQRETLLPGFLDPKRRSTVAHHEGYGRAPSEYRTVIEAQGAGLRVHGRKVGVPFALGASPVIVVGIEPDSGRLQGAVLHEALEEASVSSASVYLGLDAAPMATVSFDVMIAPDQLLGPAAADGMALERGLSRIRLINAAIAIGTARRACEYASHYATGRAAFGKPIAAFQSVAFMMAEALIQIEAARLQVWMTALTVDDSATGVLERSVSMAVTYANTVATSVTRDAVQVLGGHGFIADHPVERWYRAAAGLSTLDFDPTCSPFVAAL